MKRAIIVFCLGLFVGGLLVWAGMLWAGKQEITAETAINKERSLDKYAIESMTTRGFNSEIFFDEITASDEAFFVQKFSFQSDGKKVSGLAHIPNDCSEIKKCPMIVQIRGYADPANYMSGYGTWRSAEQFAKNGFISLAPDFLGYGGSDNPSENVFEARFQTYTTALNLLAGVKNMPIVDPDKIGLWGHSNGGQIAITILEISGKAYPTTLWAPVTIYFPYSILYYTNDSEDHGKVLRKNLAEFEADYDSDKFNLSNYFYLIIAPLLVHQGTADKSIPIEWTNETVKLLRNLGKDIVYKTYPGADHNLVPAWNEVVSADIVFFREKMGLTE